VLHVFENQRFNFFVSETTDLPMKTTDLAKGQGGYFNLQAENTTDFNTYFN
jgi:hypothetical protein